jgi:hypothetical protein
MRFTMVRLHLQPKQSNHDKSAAELDVMEVQVFSKEKIILQLYGILTESP